MTTLISRSLQVNYPAAELRGIKIQNLFPRCHSCPGFHRDKLQQESRVSRENGNPFLLNSSLLSQGLRLDSRFRGSDSDLGFLSNPLNHFAFGDPVFIRPAELSGIQQGFL
jgi:hypothetical protein